MVDKKAVLAGYEDVATAYTADRSPGQDEHDALRSFLDRVGSDARVLDAGCGGGRPVLRRLTDQSGAAVGVDLSAAQLEIATSEAPDARLLRGDMAWLPFLDSSFDAVVALHSLIHVPSEQHQTVVDEFARVLRPGGHLLVSEGPQAWQGTNPDWLGAGAEMQWHIAGAETTRAQLETAGFAVDAEHRAPDRMADAEDARWVFFEATLH